MTTTSTPLTVRIAFDHAADVRRRIEGPTAAQVRKARALVAELKLAADAAFEAGRSEQGFNLSERAFDIACEFRAAGYEIEEG